MCKKCDNCPLGESGKCSSGGEKPVQTVAVPVGCASLCGDCAKALTIGNDGQAHCDYCEPQFFI